MPWLTKGQKPVKPFAEQRDNTNNFLVQQERDTRLIEATQRYPLVDLDLWLYLFPDVAPSVLKRRLQRLVSVKAMYAYPALAGTKLVYTHRKLSLADQPNFKHTLAESWFWTRLDRALASTDSAIRERLYDYQIKAMQVPGVSPDSFARLYTHKENPLFVEIDRATESIEGSRPKTTYLVNKGLAYLTHRHELQEKFSVDTFRVAIVTTTEQRTRNIVQAFVEYHDRQGNHPWRNGIFLVSSKEVIDEGKIFERWKSPKNNEVYSL